jgi:ABC-type branched-subunit amino acid transport system substrate-binding protein
MTPFRAPVFVVVISFLSFTVSVAPVRAQTTGQREARRITLGVVEPKDGRQDSASTSSSRGTTLGVEEAQRTAAMFGWELAVLRAPDSMRASPAIEHLSRAGATVVVGDFSGVDIEPRGSLSARVIFDIGPGDAPRPCSDGRFRLMPGLASPLQAWHGSLERFGAGQLNERYRKRFGAEMDGRAWAGWMAVKIVIDAALKAQTTDPRILEAFLVGSARFDGHKGVPLFFEPATRQLMQPLFSLGSGEPELVRMISASGSTAAKTRPGCPGE